MTIDLGKTKKGIRNLLRYKEKENEDGVFYFRGKKYYWMTGDCFFAYFNDFFDIEEIYSLDIIPRDEEKAITILMELLSLENDKLYYFFAEFLLQESFLLKHLLPIFKGYLSDSRPTLREAAIRALDMYYLKHFNNGLDFLFLLRDHLKIERYGKLRYTIIQFTKMYLNLVSPNNSSWKDKGALIFREMLEYELKHEKNEETLELSKKYYEKYFS